MSMSKFFWLQKQSAITCIYKIQHISGRCYVGKSRTFQQRISSHLTMLKNKTHHCNELRNFVASLEEFTFIILEVLPEDISEEDLYLKEVLWWDKQKEVFNDKPKRSRKTTKTNEKKESSPGIKSNPKRVTGNTAGNPKTKKAGTTRRGRPKKDVL